jgi:hypothetical protein
MAAVRQELGKSENSFEEQALGEVQGYIEKIEKKSEVVTDQGNVGMVQPVGVQTQSPMNNDMATVVAQSIQKQGKPNIVLPLTEVELQEGLHHRVIDGIRWLAEWCRLMIKKYPGRVFYPVEVR